MHGFSGAVAVGGGLRDPRRRRRARRGRAGGLPARAHQGTYMQYRLAVYLVAYTTWQLVANAPTGCELAHSIARLISEANQ